MTDYQFFSDTQQKIDGDPKNCVAGYKTEAWMKNLEVLLQSINEEAITYLSPFGQFAIREVIINILVTQARIVTLVRNNPEILEEKIEAPIVILGPPRTMTSHLQAILSKHSDTEYLSFLDGNFPLEPENIDPEFILTSADSRVYETQQQLKFFNYICPLFGYMFRFDKDTPHNTIQEDIFIQQLVFASPIFETQMYIPTYSNMFHKQDLTSTYRFLKMTQKVMQYQRRKRLGQIGKYWLMKTPEHAGFIQNLITVYPDAQIILTSRDPISIIKSFAPMMTYVFSFWNNKIDPERVASYQIDILETRLRNLVKQIDLVPKSQLLHIKFPDFVNDSMAITRKVCEFTGLNLTADNVNKMEQYINNSPRDGAMRFKYMIESFGPEFDSEIIANRFTFYSQKFAQYIN